MENVIDFGRDTDVNIQQFLCMPFEMEDQKWTAKIPLYCLTWNKSIPQELPTHHLENT